jgi:hypothetical protein
MHESIRILTALLFLIIQAAPSQAPLFFREGWNGRKAPGTLPMNQADVANPNLVLQLYGPGANGPARDPENTLNVNVREPGGRGGGGANADPESLSFIWSGMSEGNWAVTLKHRNSYVDLTRPGSKIRWRTQQDGVAQVLRPVLKLANGTYVLGVQGSGTTAEYETKDLIIADMRWVDFDAVRVLDRGNQKSPFGYTSPDLSRVDEIGFTTLSRGGGHGVGVSSHVDWIEVYGVPVPRN